MRLSHLPPPSAAVPSTALLLALSIAGASAGGEPGPGALRYTRVTHRYQLPPVTLVGQDGRPVPISEAFPRDATVALNFIFTNCRTICPRLAGTLAGLRKQLGTRAEAIQAVSVSIDPRYDTPERLREYKARLDAGAGWTFFTGEAEDIERVLRAFDAFSQARFDHRPLTLLRAAHTDEWIRLEGEFTSEDLRRELLALSARGRSRVQGREGPRLPR